MKTGSIGILAAAVIGILAAMPAGAQQVATAGTPGVIAYSGTILDEAGRPPYPGGVTPLVLRVFTNAAAIAGEQPAWATNVNVKVRADGTFQADVAVTDTLGALLRSADTPLYLETGILPKDSTRAQMFHVRRPVRKVPRALVVETAPRVETLVPESCDAGAMESALFRAGQLVVWEWTTDAEASIAFAESGVHFAAARNRLDAPQLFRKMAAADAEAVATRDGRLITDVFQASSSGTRTYFPAGSPATAVRWEDNAPPVVLFGTLP